MGAAGDMLAAALLELLPDRQAFIEKFHKVGIPEVHLAAEKTTKCGITGTHVSMRVNGEEEHSEDDNHHDDHDDHDHSRHSSAFDTHGGYMHEHTHAHQSMHEIEEIVGKLHIDEQIRQDVLAVYRLIAEAESAVHGTEGAEIHFHEVGTLDAIADITAVCMLLREIAPDEIIASPVATGFGAVRCAHGILPVPAPATEILLRGIPMYAGRIEGELCTPTGAALLKHFVTRYGQMPVMTIRSTGYGMGKKDFPRANCVRAFFGEREEENLTDTIFELSCNVDDMTGEEIGFAMEQLFEAGAREVYTLPVYMKKNRPGTLIRVIVTEDKKDTLVRAVFRYTSTIGIREAKMKRYVLERHVTREETVYGTMRRKDVSGYGVKRSKWEYEDLAQAAREQGCPIREIQNTPALHKESKQ